MKVERYTPPGRCPKCSSFMNWRREWGDLWRCLDCGEIVKTGDGPSTRRAVEDAIDRSKNRNSPLVKEELWTRQS